MERLRYEQYCGKRNFGMLTAMDIKWLAEQLDRPGYSQAGLARALGRDPASVSRMLKGERQIKANEVPLIERYLDAVPESDTRPAPNAPARPYRGDWAADIPVMGTTVGGDHGHGDFEMNGEVAYHVPRPPRFTGRRDVFALIVQGTSMSPWREPGSLVYVEGSRPPRNGEYVVIEMKARNGDHVRPTFLKKLLATTATKLRLLQYEPRREFEIDRARVLHVYRVIESDELLGV
jgi:phage repressor protein C with HTH and peptisase S24 domain